MRYEVLYAGVGKYVHNENVLDVFDWQGNLILEVVKNE